MAEPSPDGFNPSIAQEHHVPNQHIPPGVPSQQDGALWNRLQREFVQQTATMNSNAAQHASLAHLEANQNTNPLPNQSSDSEATFAEQNQQDANSNSSLPGTPTTLSGGPHNTTHGQVPPHILAQ
ncbi:hypothetical protein FRB99_001616, partial [Tulasnella sp. 403]